MEFQLSDDQEALRQAARDLLDDLAAPVRVRTHLASGEPFDKALWAAMLEQGWMGVAQPEESGGLGLGWVEAAVLLEEIGRHTAPAPFLPSLLALDALADAANPWAARLLGGDAIGCVAWSPGRPSGHAPTSAAASSGSLGGRVGPVIAADVADVAVLCTPAALYAVDLRTDGPPPAAEPAMDGTRTLAWLDLDGRTATEIGGPEAAEELLNRATVAFCAEMLGGAARVLEMAAEYAKERVQFGQPIGSFQAVKHRCADMVVDVEGMRSTTWYAAWCLGAGGEDGAGASIAASAAKVWCADASRRVMASGLQVHGGIGFTWEHDLHLYLKRSQLDQLSFGDANFHRDRLAGLLRARVDSGASVI